MPPQSSLTIRISNLPVSASKDDVVAAAELKLSEYVSGDANERLKCIKSLIAANPNDGGKTQVAVITLDRSLPLFLGGEDEKTVPLDLDGNCYSVTVDRHFRGLTCLHDGGADACGQLASGAETRGVGVVDLIFVTGLAGHAYGSWKASGQTTMWLEDFLMKEDFNDRFRVLIYGYDTSLVHSTSTAGISDFARIFLGIVAGARSPSKNSRRGPIIFFGHSLGGLVVKRAICVAASAGTENPDYHDIIENTFAAFFFGVPNSGIHVEELGHMVKGQANQHLIHDLRPESTFLELLHDNFHHHIQEKLRRFRIVTIFEKKETETVKQIDGVWRRAGERKLMVPRSSALSHLSCETPDDILPRDADHSGIAKFSSSNDPDYYLLRDKIRKYVDEAGKPIEERPNKASLIGNTKERNHFHVPYPRNSGYVQRPDISGKLENLLLQKNGDEQMKVAICALGGAGKTQVLLNFAYQSKQTYNVFWIYGASIELIQADYIKIAKQVNLPTEGKEPEAICLTLKDWLDSEKSRDWLLLVDNVDSLDEALTTGIHTYFPNKRGTIIFTTRNRSIVGKLVQPRHCLYLGDGMTLDEALAMFITEPDIDTKDTECIMALLEELGYLPLAIAQTTGYLRRTGIGAAEYLERLRKHEFKLLSQPYFETSGPTHEAVMKTWDISYQYIQNQNESAIKLLEILSLLAYQDVPKSLLTSASGGPLQALGIDDEMDFDKALSWLISFNLVSSFQSAAEPAFKLHRLVSLWTRNMIGDRTDTKIIVLDILELQFSGNIPNKVQELSKVALHVEAIFKHIEQNSVLDERLYSLQNSYAIYLREAGSYSSAETIIKKCVEYFEKTLGEDHIFTIQAINEIANTLRELGKYSEAREWLQRGLAVCEDGRPLDKRMATAHADLMQSMALLFDYEGDYNIAMEWYPRALDIFRTVLDEDDLRILDVKNNMGDAYCQLDRYDEALQFLNEALSGYEKLIGKEDPRTLNTVQKIAGVFAEQQRHSEALEWYQRALAGQERILGDSHPDTLGTVNQMALFLSDIGKFDDALRLYERVNVLAGYTRLLGRMHCNTLAALHNIAWVHLGQHKHKEALEQFKQVLADKQAVLPANHPAIYNTIKGVAICYKRLGIPVYGSTKIPERFREYFAGSLPPDLEGQVLYHVGSPISTEKDEDSMALDLLVQADPTISSEEDEDLETGTQDSQSLSDAGSTISAGNDKDWMTVDLTQEGRALFQADPTILYHRKKTNIWRLVRRKAKSYFK